MLDVQYISIYRVSKTVCRKLFSYENTHKVCWISICVTFQKQSDFNHTLSICETHCVINATSASIVHVLSVHWPSVRLQCGFSMQMLDAHWVKFHITIQCIIQTWVSRTAFLLRLFTMRIAGTTILNWYQDKKSTRTKIPLTKSPQEIWTYRITKKFVSKCWFRWYFQVIILINHPSLDRNFDFWSSYQGFYGLLGVLAL